MFDIKISPIKIEDSKVTNTGSFLQTPFWGEFKARHGWSLRRFNVTVNLSDEKLAPKTEASDKNTCTHNSDKNDGWGGFPKETLIQNQEFSVMNRSFAKGLFSIAYIPLFPGLPYKCTEKDLIERALDGGNKCGSGFGTETDTRPESSSRTRATAENPQSEVLESIIPQTIITPETQTIEFATMLSELGLALKPFLPKNTIAIRFDPDVDFESPEDRNLFNYGVKTVAYADRLKLKKNRVDIQPPDTSLVDLTGSEEEILNKMHSKWRYNIRLSERKGVKIEKYLGNILNLSEKIDKFYQLTKETNARDGNASHAKSYYKDLIEFSASEIAAGHDVPQISLYIAEHESEEIASIMTLFSKDEAIYLYGASSNHKRNLMPNHLLQWTAMKDAKAYGSKYYDMYGMPPEGKDENHPMHGLYMFKTNFGGRNIHRTGSWDVPLKAAYRPYRAAESLRAWWHKKVLKKIRGR